MYLTECIRWFFGVARTLSLAAVLLLLASGISLPQQDPAERPFPPLATTAPRTPLDKIPGPGIFKNFRLVTHNSLNNLGAFAGLSIAGDCAYVGSRFGMKGIQVLDISDPQRPRVVTTVGPADGRTARETRASADLHTLVVLSFQGNSGRSGNMPPAIPPLGPAAPNNLDIYDISNCEQPVHKARLDMGAERPHEMFLWRDPANPSRALVYVSMSNNVPELRVFDITGIAAGPSLGTIPAMTKQIASYTLTLLNDGITPSGIPIVEPINPATQEFGPAQFPFAGPPFNVNPPTSQGNGLHSMSVSDDGTRTFMAGSSSGHYIVDSTAVANGTCVDPAPNICLKKRNPDPLARIDSIPPEGGGHHTLAKVPGRPYLIATIERSGNNQCPWNFVRILESSSEISLAQVGSFALPENDPAFCETISDPTTFTMSLESHNPLVLSNLVFITWYAGGLRAIDISNPRFPHEVGHVFNQPVHEDLLTNVYPGRVPNKNTEIWMWSYPILKDGLLYVVDINSGLYVLEYNGPRREEVPQQGIVESNANQIPAILPPR